MDVNRPKKRLKLEESSDPVPESQRTEEDVTQSLYLETVNRSQLDFDQEKLCSVTLSNLNVYSCLICGKYFSGRSKNTPAFFHALELDHHVFLNLSTLKAYILPDLYENKNIALADLKYAVAPTYTKEDVRRLETDVSTCFDLSRTPYRPGFVGMNNLKGSDHLGVVIHALSHVAPIRNFLLLEDLASRTELVQSFGLLVKKLWSSKLLKAHLSPHEFVRKALVSMKSDRSALNKFAEPQDFMAFLIITFHLALGGSRTKPKQQSILSSCFQGSLCIETQKVFAVAESSTNERLRFESDTLITKTSSPFMYLTLDLPPTPLFQDEVQRNIIPQISIVDLLNKYNGSQVQEFPGYRRRYTIERLPPYLIFHIKRFTHSQFSMEKNPTIVNFPLRSLDMTPYFAEQQPSSAESDGTIYDLLVNITHESIFNSAGDESHVFRTQIRDRANEKWVQMEGLFVQEIKKDMICIGESVLQIWEKRKRSSNHTAREKEQQKTEQQQQQQ